MYAEYIRSSIEPRAWRPRTLAEWERRREIVRKRVLDDLGLLPLPDRLPLEVHRGGKLERDDYTVERIYWQTWPDYYAAGRLYMPTDAEWPAPAILNPHGHWPDGNKNATVQARLVALARMGYVCLTVDSVHFYDWATGVVPIGIMTWNNIRGIDLLESLPEVDADRIGCTGCSGGGQQAMYLMAVEDRIKVAVPVGLVCNFEMILSPDMAHCACNHVPGIRADTEQPEMAAVFAPRPSLFISMTGDWTRLFPQEGYPDVRHVYSLYGAMDSVASAYHDSPHDYNRDMQEQAYRLFDQRLRGGDGEVHEGEIAAEPVETLAALDSPPPGAAGPEAIVREFRDRRGFRFPPARTREGAQNRAADFRERLRRLLREPRTLKCSADVLGRSPWRGLVVEKLAIRTEPSVRIPAILLRPVADTPTAGVVVVDPAGAASCLVTRADELCALVAEGNRVLVVDARYFGEWAIDENIASLNGIVLGRPTGAVGTHDIRCAAAYLRSRDDVVDEQVSLLGFGDGGVLALFAVCLDREIEAVRAMGLGPTYLAGREQPQFAHLLTVGDLPQIVACIAPRPVHLAGVADPDVYAPAAATYAIMDAGDGLSVAQ